MTSDWILLLIGPAFFLLGCLMIWFGLRNRKLAKASKSWPSAAGKIVVSQVMRSYDAETKRDTYSADVQYEYTVGGETLRGKRVQFGAGWSTNTARRPAEALVARYPAGAAVSVFYDPAAPSQCTLEQSASGSNIVLFIIGAAFIIIGLPVGVVFWAGRNADKDLMNELRKDMAKSSAPKPADVPAEKPATKP
jgi:uncharacterized protein DUF3592